MTDLNIIHDGPLDIATGNSRKAKTWKNGKVTWSGLIKKLSKTHYTHETHEQYMAGAKDWQDSIKDIGGFVGGYLAGGRRGKGTVLHRSMVTLDVDFGKVSADVWTSFCLLYECAGLVYSTHKHTPSHPRIRLIIPLDREVTADEYVAIARGIAGDLDIDQFDPTTFQPERLMYWPSTSKDAEYLFNYVDAPWLIADAVLSTYVNWQDSSEWPVSAKESEAVRRGIKKQEDPREKRGMVGAFCRCYGITECIETFLTDHYDPTTDPLRWTYKLGSTAGGLVVYDDLFAFSHHGTDPASLKLCNAFDLCRLHLFGPRDEDSKEQGVKLPSYKAMMDFISKDPNVRALQAAERLEGALEDFEDIPGSDMTDAEMEAVLAEKPLPVAESGNKWMGVSDTDGADSSGLDDSGLAGIIGTDRDTDGKPAWLKDLEIDPRKAVAASTINNVVLILENDERLRGRFRLDEFSGWPVLTVGKLPWRIVTANEVEFTNDDAAGLRHFLEHAYGISHEKKVKDALNIVFRRHRFHPVREYLNGLVWDEVDRVDEILIRYLGAEDTEYNRVVMRKAMVAAVARIYQPGIKYDDMLILSGPQGCGKSTLFARLGQGWFTDNFNFHMLSGPGVRAQEQIRGHWIIEAGEMSGLGKADLEATKSFLRAQVDTYRGAYKENPAKHPRQCVIVGSTNKDRFLRDQTGNRSFDVVPVMVQKPLEDIFSRFTGDVIHQVWAEAVRLYKAGERLTMPGYLLAEAKNIQNKFMETDERAGLVEWFLDLLLPDTWEGMDTSDRRQWLTQEKESNNLNAKGIYSRRYVTVAEIWIELFGKNPADMTFYNTHFIHDIMKNMTHWEFRGEQKRRTIHGRYRYYSRVKGGPDMKITGPLNEITGPPADGDMDP